MAKFKEVPPEVSVSDLTPLDISCTSTKCDDNFHCFKHSQKAFEKYKKDGVCRVCGANLVDWNRVHSKDLDDHEYTFNALRYELIRHIFWHANIEVDAINKAKKRGLDNLKEHAKVVLTSKIGKARNYREGYQTPKKGKEIVHYAQHATATCCRPCLSYWHGIPEGRALRPKEIDYCSNLIMLFITERVKNWN